MKTQSRKSKGRWLQKWVRDKIIEAFNLPVEDVQSTSMGAGGIDVKLSNRAREYFPYAIECKNQESLNIYKAYEQACDHGTSTNKNDTKLEPLLIIKKNRKPVLAVVDAEWFINIHKRLNNDK